MINSINADHLNRLFDKIYLIDAFNIDVFVAELNDSSP